MKLFSVHVDRDRSEPSTVEDGVRTKKIDRIVYRYAAESIESVWERHHNVLIPEFDTLIGVIEDAPAIELIPSAGSGA